MVLAVSLISELAFLSSLTDGPKPLHRSYVLPWFVLLSPSTPAAISGLQLFSPVSGARCKKSVYRRPSKC